MAASLEKDFRFSPQRRVSDLALQASLVVCLGSGVHWLGEHLYGQAWQSAHHPEIGAYDLASRYAHGAADAFADPNKPNIHLARTEVDSFDNAFYPLGKAEESLVQKAKDTRGELYHVASPSDVEVVRKKMYDLALEFEQREAVFQERFDQEPSVIAREKRKEISRNGGLFFAVLTSLQVLTRLYNYTRETRKVQKKLSPSNS